MSDGRQLIRMRGIYKRFNVGLENELEILHGIDLTVYPGVGHNCWEKAYTDPTLIAWMLEQHL